MSKAKKKAAAKPAKKTTATKTAQPAAKKSTAPAAKEHPMTKKHLHNETQEFYAAHPNAKPLIIIFILLSVTVLIYLMQVRLV